MDEGTPSASTGRTNSSLSHTSGSSAPVRKALRNSRKKSDLDKRTELFLDSATSVLSNNNKYRAFGNSVAFQLEDLDRRQQVIAEKLISEVLFHGKLGNLKESATILTAQQSQRTMTSNTNHPYPYRSESFSQEPMQPIRYNMQFYTLFHQNQNTWQPQAQQPRVHEQNTSLTQLQPPTLGNNLQELQPTFTNL